MIYRVPIVKKVYVLKSRPFSSFTDRFDDFLEISVDPFQVPFDFLVFFVERSFETSRPGGRPDFIHLRTTERRDYTSHDVWKENTTDKHIMRTMGIKRYSLLIVL